MRNMRMKFFGLCLLGICAASSLFAELKPVPLTSEDIVFQGARYIYRQENLIEPLRFSKEVLDLGGPALNFNPDVARMAAGIKLFVSTDSSEIKINLTLKPFRYAGEAYVRVYRDGEVLKDFEFKRMREDTPVEVTIKSSDGDLHLYRIDLPATSEVLITNLSIDKESVLQPVQLESKPVYVALGDSLTQGSVALNGISALGYPALLGDRLGMDVYNLGVGGGRVSVKGGEMLADWDRIDLMTLLIGANDFSWAKVPPDRYRRTYEALLSVIRKHHPDVPLFCITLTYTTRETGDGGQPTEEYRQVVRDVVKAAQDAGDKNLYLIEGDELTDKGDLHDWVHLNQKGNQRFADELYEVIFNTISF